MIFFFVDFTPMENAFSTLKAISATCGPIFCSVITIAFHKFIYFDVLKHFRSL